MGTQFKSNWRSHRYARESGLYARLSAAGIGIARGAPGEYSCDLLANIPAIYIVTRRSVDSPLESPVARDFFHGGSTAQRTPEGI